MAATESYPGPFCKELNIHTSALLETNASLVELPGITPKHGLILELVHFAAKHKWSNRKVANWLQSLFPNCVQYSTKTLESRISRTVETKKKFQKKKKNAKFKTLEDFQGALFVINTNILPECPNPVKEIETQNILPQCPRHCEQVENVQREILEVMENGLKAKRRKVVEIEQDDDYENETVAVKNMLPNMMNGFNDNEYIAVAYQDTWYPGCVLKTVSSDKASVSFMAPCRKPGTFMWPSQEDIQIVEKQFVLERGMLPECCNSGRQWYFTDYRSIDELFKKYREHYF